jgi:hypothetical protein
METPGQAAAVGEEEGGLGGVWLPHTAQEPRYLWLDTQPPHWLPPAQAALDDPAAAAAAVAAPSMVSRDADGAAGWDTVEKQAQRCSVWDGGLVATGSTVVSVVADQPGGGGQRTAVVILMGAACCVILALGLTCKYTWNPGKHGYKHVTLDTAEAEAEDGEGISRDSQSESTPLKVLNADV